MDHFCRGKRKKSRTFVRKIQYFSITIYKVRKIAFSTFIIFTCLIKCLKVPSKEKNRSLNSPPSLSSPFRKIAVPPPPVSACVSLHIDARCEILDPGPDRINHRDNIIAAGAASPFLRDTTRALTLFIIAAYSMHCPWRFVRRRGCPRGAARDIGDKWHCNKCVGKRWPRRDTRNPPSVMVIWWPLTNVYLF